jgi:pimeloyl-ACP methyl ester carboxylesterase
LRAHVVIAALVVFAAGLTNGAQVVAQSTIRAADISGAFADLPGRQIWYIDSGGSGVPIVFLHAGTGSSAVWEFQLPAVRVAGYRFIAYDRLGSGQSMLAAGADLRTASDDLEALAQHLRLPSFHLVGTAAGGIVALDYALSYPTRLRSLVVANSIGGVQDDDYLALSRRLRPAPQFNALPTEIRELGPSYRAANPAGTAHWIELEHQSRAKAPLPLAQRNRNRLTFELLETLRVPTLLLTGDADLYLPPSVLRVFAARIRGAETLIVPETGHSAYWEQPEIFNRAVLQFIAKH